MIVNDTSTATFTARPTDTNGASFVPTNARYRLDDKASGNSLIAWTDLTPSAAMPIIIPASAHAMVDTNLATEVKVLTVETDYSTVSAHNEELEYEVKNLQFVS